MISGFFLPEFVPHPLIQLAVRVPIIRPEWVVVSFIVDTGSSLTALHAGDAQDVFGWDPANLDPVRWDRTAKAEGISGGIEYFPTPANFGLQRDDGTWEVVDETLHIGGLATGSTPAILGWNILEHFELLVNRKNGTVRLTRV